MFKSLKEPLKYLAFIIASLALITACGGGGSNSDAADSNQADPDEITVQGAAVKGPLAHAQLNVYLIDAKEPDFKGRLIATGSTDEHARVQGIIINSRRLDAKYLIEVSSSADTLDLSSGDAPLIPTLRSIISLNGGGEISKTIPQVFITPLSTFAVDLAFARIRAGQTTNITVALNSAQTLVANSFGMGLLNDPTDGTVDLFESSPLLTDSNGQTQARTHNYRIASEVFAAIVVDLQQRSNATANEIITALAIDLNDGDIDGTNNGDPLAALADIPVMDLLVATAPANPENLYIPGTNSLVSETGSLLETEAQQLGSAVSPDTGELGAMPALKPIITGTDSDGDGIIDSLDPCPNDPNGTVDTDGDGVCDNVDAFPNDPNETHDSDGDGTGDNADQCPNGYGITDADGDGRCAVLPGDTYILNAGMDFNDNDASIISVCDDGSGATDQQLLDYGCDEDDDNDSVPNSLDLFPLNGDEWADSDNDCASIPNFNPDTPTSGNGCGDNSDLFPDNPDEYADSDNDCNLGNGIANTVTGIVQFFGSTAGNGCGDNSDPAVSFSGTLTNYVGASGFNDPPNYLAGDPDSIAALNYKLEVVFDNQGLYQSSTLVLNGYFTNLGSTIVPAFAQNRFDYTNAVFTNSDGVVSNLNLNTGTGTLTVNGGVTVSAGDTIVGQPYASGSKMPMPVNANNATCTGYCTGGIPVILGDIAYISFEMTDLDTYTLRLNYITTSATTGLLLY